MSLPDPRMSPNGDGPRPASVAGIWAALSTVYVVWGSTYLAIRVAVRTLPPLLMASTRFLIAGALLYAWAIRRGDREGDRPTRGHWISAFVIGGALLLGGNGAVVLAERTVPSGISSLIVATVPLFMALMARFILKERFTWREALGVGLGFAGIALLVQTSGSEGTAVSGLLLLVLASASWAAGSLYARKASLPARPLVGTAMEMMAGGLLLGIAGIIRGELSAFHPAQFSLESLLGFAYLVVFGSLVGFTAYAWLLRVARTSLVSTYAYVNPVVAVLLGWTFLSEEITLRTLLAGAVIVAAVALIVTARAAARRPIEAPVPEAEPEAAAERPSSRGSAYVRRIFSSKSGK